MLKTKKLFIALLVGAVVANPVIADEKANQLDKKFLDDSSYALGVMVAKDIERLLESQKDMITYNKPELLSGVSDTLNGKNKLSDEKLSENLQALEEKLKQLSTEQNADNLKKGEAFRNEYAKKKNVKKTSTGILYLIEKPGSGTEVKPTDTVKVNYKGTLIDGTVFDSSYDRGEPIEFQLNQLIPGWIEGIPLIKKGGKIQLVIPSQLAYGEQPTGTIPANSTLIFDIELLDNKPAAK